MSLSNGMFSIAGSPFSCVVDAIDGGFVTAFGHGLVGGFSGKEAEFTVVAQKGTASTYTF